MNETATVVVARMARGMSKGMFLAFLALFLSPGQSASAAGGDSFAEAIDLGTTTQWEASGREFVGTIEDVEGEDNQYLKFKIEVAGPIRVWTTGGFNPYLRLFDNARIPVTSWSSSERYLHPVEAGDYYVVANSRNAGRYRLRLAGGGEGHDDIGNVHDEADLVQPTQGSDEPSLGTFRIDFGRDRDFFKFEVPPGSRRWVRIYTTGAIDTWGALYDSYEIELETNDDSGADANFHIDRALAPGTHYIGVWGRYTSTIGPYRLHVSMGDDHGNLFETASRAQLSSVIPGSIGYINDDDIFWFQVSTRGNVVIQTTGAVDTYGVLYDSHEIELERNYNSGADYNFLIDRVLEPGTYYIYVSGYRSARGDYKLHLSGEASGVAILPLIPSANDPRLQGFVRLINHSAATATVGVTAVDDTGMRRGSFDLELAPWKTIHFNSDDLEYGNSNKGIDSGVGSGMGNWYLELAPSRPEVEALAFIRTPSDGFLTAMHAHAPSYGREHRVGVFNPGGNRNQVSKLRLIHPRCPQAESGGECNVANVTIFGVDDDGVRSPNVRLQLDSGAAREVTAAQLEDPDSASADGLEGGLGVGKGKWQLFVSADQPLHVLSLLESPTGHLTNLSAPATRQIFPTAPSRTSASQSAFQALGAGVH